MKMPHEKPATERRIDAWIARAAKEIAAEFREWAARNGITFEEARAELERQLEEDAEYRQMGLPTPNFRLD